VQGLTTQILLEKLGMTDNQPQRQKFLEAIARRIALKRVMNYLSQAEQYQEVEPEFCRYQAELVEGQLKSIEEEITQLQKQHPHLRALAMEQLQDKLLNIEADTYAELIRAGQLDNKLSPLLEDVLAASEENLID
jgi:CPA1 family monovalent cation:H+ antiporter